jgi:18S rRNA (adenine1779-N6/adenine1780-N6)-dimethyltransferase
MWCRLAANVQLYARVEHIMKVGKGNFRPPPQVESSVIRLSPRDPPPPIRFEEFDGLNRIIFSRMNKHTRACFGAKGVKEMLEKNYRTWCAENGKVSQSLSRSRMLESIIGLTLYQIIEDDFDMKVKIEEILVESGFAESRAAKMDVDDLLK